MHLALIIMITCHFTLHVKLYYFVLVIIYDSCTHVLKIYPNQQANINFYISDVWACNW